MKIEKKQVFSNLGICLHCILKPAQATFSKETITASNFTLGIQKTLCSTMKHNKNLQKKIIKFIQASATWEHQKAFQYLNDNCWIILSIRLDFHLALYLSIWALQMPISLTHPVERLGSTTCRCGSSYYWQENDGEWTQHQKEQNVHATLNKNTCCCELAKYRLARYVRPIVGICRLHKEFTF